MKRSCIILSIAISVVSSASYAQLRGIRNSSGSAEQRPRLNGGGSGAQTADTKEFTFSGSIDDVTRRFRADRSPGRLGRLSMSN
jgi:hypothetical protein